MKLEDKFKTWLDSEPRKQLRDIQCVEIANAHAIGFAEWLIWQDITSRGKGVFVDAVGKIVTTKDLLEIYNTSN